MSIHAASDAEIPLAWVPSYADLPMERAYTITPETDEPMAVLRKHGRGRVAFLPMDLDRAFALRMVGDLLKLLRAAVDWVRSTPATVVVDGSGLVDVAVRRQESSMTVHLVNMNNPMTMAGFIRQTSPCGPFTVRVTLPPSSDVRGVRLLEANSDVFAEQHEDTHIVHIPSVGVHEIVAIDL